MARGAKTPAPAGRSDLPDFGGLRAAVVGDLVADHYVMTEPSGLSREAPVLRLRHRSEHYGAGGAGNVARNLAALGARTHCLGAVGRDAVGRELIATLEADGVDVSELVTVPGWPTTTKTRVLSAGARRNPQQVLRIDREPEGPAGPEISAQMIAGLRRLRGELDVLVASDYEYGLLDADLSACVRELAAAGTVVVFDPRRRVEGFEGVTAITPNVAELALLVGRRPEELHDPRAVVDAARQLMERARPRYLLVTRGNLGMTLFGEGLDAGGTSVEAAGSGNVTDVSGAGDTAAAVFALALAAGLDALRAMAVANAASGVVVMEIGAAVCTPAALRDALPLAPPAALGVLGGAGA